MRPGRGIISHSGSGGGGGSIHGTSVSALGGNCGIAKMTQAKRRGRSAAVGPLLAKPLAYEVEHKPGVNSSVILTLDVPGETTKLCYDRAVREFSKRAGNSIPGFSAGDKHPPQIIERHFGAGEVKGEALKIISDTVVNEAINKFDFKAIGSATLVQDVGTVLNMFTPGEAMLLEVKCDVWPQVKVNGEYTGLELEIELPPVDESRVEGAWKMLQERNIVLEDTEEGYAAQLGDSVIANMEPYHENPDGSRGDSLPDIASGEEVDIVLEKGRYMPGLAEGLEGVKAGEKREIRVAFPDRISGQGGDLEGKKAIFEVETVAVKKRIVPEVDEAFANSIRADLTLEELTQEVERAVREESGTSKKDARNRAMEDALLKFTEVEMPETLVVEEAREKFAIMMTEFKDQGESDEKIKSMITKENFEKYLEIVRKNVTRGLSASLLMTYIADKENLKFDPQEVEEELDQVRAQAKGQEIDEEKVRDSIEARLEKDLVLDWIEERSTITYVEGKPLQTEKVL
ncbi:unnamed protein product [Ascophyllum nodosum]